MLSRTKNVEIETYHYVPQKATQYNPNAVMRVAAYARVSTLQENQEDSFETQCAYYERMISANPRMILVGVYGDQGVSGLSTKGRTEFARMMSDCKAGKIDLVITRSVSRLSRNMAECVETVNTLKDLGIPVKFEKEGLITTDPGSEMFFHVLATLAQEESGSLSRRLTWAVDRRAAMGDPIRKCSYGYMKEPLKNTVQPKEGRAWLINEEEAKRVRKAFEMASSLYPYDAILQQLNLIEQAAGTDVVWTQQRLYRLLRNETYRGDIQTHKTYTLDYVGKVRVKNNGDHEAYYITDHHEPMVPVEMFDRVQSLMDANMLRPGAYRKREQLEWDAERWHREEWDRKAMAKAARNRNKVVKASAKNEPTVETTAVPVEA